MGMFFEYVKEYYTDFTIILLTLVIAIVFIRYIGNENFISGRGRRTGTAFPFFHTINSPATKKPVGAVCRIDRDCMTRKCVEKVCSK